MHRRLAVPCLLCVAGLLAFLTVALTIHKMAPPSVPEVTRKLEFFREHKNSYDTLFVGSSRIYRSVSPRIFDETLRQAGFASCSFNAAIDGMVPAESLGMVQRLLDVKPRKLQRIFLEITPIEEVPRPGGPSVRDIYWQDMWSLAFALRKARSELKEGKSFGTVLHRLEPYGEYFVRNQCNLGRAVVTPEDHSFKQGGAADIRAMTERDPLGPEGDGFFPSSRTMSPTEKTEYRAELQNATAWKMEVPDPINRLEFERLRQILTAKGISLFFIGAPTLNSLRVQLTCECPLGSPFFHFDDPAEFPTLYADDRRMDADHLNIRGAEEFTRLFAEGFVRHLQAESR